MDSDTLTPPSDYPTTHDEESRKTRGPWGRTACSRCRRRKQKCDSARPACRNCRRAHIECDISNLQHDPLPISYTRALEDRIAGLEIQIARLQENAAFPTWGRDAEQFLNRTCEEAGGSNLQEISDILAMGRHGSSAHIGESSGFILAQNLAEMVQATVFNKGIAPGIPSDWIHSSDRAQNHPSVGRRPMNLHELLRDSADPPDDQEGTQLINTYIAQMHSRYPFLDTAELWRTHEHREILTTTDKSSLTVEDRFSIFKLHLVYATGARLMQIMGKSLRVGHERYYTAALKHLDSARDGRSVRNIEAMVLLVIYHVRSATSHALWYLIGHAMRTCIDLGLHSRIHEAGMDHRAIMARRRLFWAVYSLERLICITLGRPPSIPDQHIDVELPLVGPPDTGTNRADGMMSNPASETPGATSLGRVTENFALSLHLVRLRQLESQIYQTVYRIDQPPVTRLLKVPKHLQALRDWKVSLSSHACSSGDLAYGVLLYHRGICLLLRPFLAMLTPADEYYQVCLQSASGICKEHKQLHRQLAYGHSFIAVQEVFVAGITILYCLWTSTTDVWSFSLSEDLRACSSVLFVMSERTGWVAKYRDAFELLVTATTEKLQGNIGSDGSIVRSAEAIAKKAQNPAPQDDPECLEGEQQDHLDSRARSASVYYLMSDSTEAMSVVRHFSNWWDQYGMDPVWIPSYEAMDDL